MEIELGVALIRLADPNRGGDLLDRVAKGAAEVAADIGILMPKVRIRDNMRLDQNAYRIKIGGQPGRRSGVHPQHVAGDRLGSRHGADHGYCDARSGVRHGGRVD